MDDAGPLDASSLGQSLSPEQRRIAYLCTTLRNIESASTNSTVKEIQASLQKARIRVFRGGPNEDEEALPTALICESAGKVIDLFSGRRAKPPSHAVSNLSSEMHNFYSNEDERFDAFSKQLSLFLGFTKSESTATGDYSFRSKHGPDGFRDKPLEGSKRAISLLIEAKWEIGTSGDPTMQICLEYAATAGEMCAKGIGGHFPCLLVTISGTMLTAQLGVVGECAQVEFLGCHSLQSADLQSGAQFMMALKEAVQIIEDDYDDSSPTKVQHVDIPYVHDLNVGGNDVTIEYQRALKRGTSFVYKVAVVPGEYRHLLPPHLIVKFVRGRYGHDVHRFLDDQFPLPTQRVCPRLFDLRSLPGGWTAVVMDYIEALPCDIVLSMDASAKFHIIEVLTAAADALHKAGFVHGDLREPNILLCRGDGGRIRPFIVDFDLAGKESEVTYPVDLNFCAFLWLPEEAAGGPIERKDDLDALKFYAKDFLDVK